MNSSSFSQIFSQFQDAVGIERAFDSENATRMYGPSTLSRESPRILAALKPMNREEIVNVVKIAAAHAVPLYPISIGNNWGYGSKNPATDSCVIVDLSRMNRILSFNALLGTITVEPGVTTADVSSFLEKEGAPFVAPVVGAGPRSSMVGNALDKGVSSSPSHDRASSILALSAILPDGSIYESNGTHGPQTYRWGVGPHLDGLFLQNGIGIVTSATFLLAPKSEHAEAFFIPAHTAKRAGMLIETLHRLSLRLPGVLASFQVEGPLRSFAHFTPRLHSNLTRENVTGRQPVAKRLKELGLGNWNGLVLFRGERTVVAAATSIARATLTHAQFSIRQHSLSSAQRQKRLINLLPKWSQPNTAHLKLLTTFIERSTGISKPHDSRWFPLWRHTNTLTHEKSLREEISDIDADDKAGFLLFVAAFGADLPYTNVVDSIETTCVRFGMEPMYGTLGLATERYLHVAVQLTFDKQNVEETKHAHACYEALFNEMLAYGGLPYRIPITTPHLLHQLNTKRWPLAEAIQRAVDPQNIMAPGRYRPPHHS